MKLQQLQVFATVVRTGGFRSAAAALNLTQAAVSKSVHALEENCGLPLLVRSAQGIHLTPHGEYLYGRAKVLLDEVRETKEGLAVRRGLMAGSIRFACNSAVMLSCLGEFLPWFRKRFPATSIGLMDGGLMISLQALREHRIDFAVCAVGEEWPSDQFMWEPVCCCEQVYAVREGHPLLGQEIVDGQAIARYEWVIIAESFEEARDRFAHCMPQVGIPLSEKYLTAGDAMSAVELVRASDAILIVPEIVVSLNGFRKLPVVDSVKLPHLNFTLIMRKDFSPSMACEYLIHCVKKTMQEKFQALPGDSERSYSQSV